jgi:hypothetical protein
MESVENRLSRLEGTSNKWRSLALVQAVLVCALCAWGFSQKPGAIASKPGNANAKPGTVTANQFVLVDDQGKPKATLNYNYGVVTFELTTGQYNASLQVGKQDGAVLNLVGPQSQVWAAATNPPTISISKGEKTLFSKP